MNKIELQQELNNTLYQIRFYNGKLSKIITTNETARIGYYQELIAANEKYYKFLKERLANV